MATNSLRFAGALLGVLLPGLARAEGAPPLPSSEPEASSVAQLQAAIDAADPLFAKYVVSPLATVLFADVMFWDNGVSRVNAVTWSGERLVSGGEDGLLVVHEAPQRQLDLGAGPIRVLRAAPEGSGQVAVGWSTGDVALVSLADGAVVRRLPSLQGGEPTALAFGASGTIVVGTSDGRVLAFEGEGAPRDLYRSPGVSIRGLAVDSSTAAARVAWTTSDDELFLGALSGGNPRALSGHRRGAGPVAFGPGDLTLASGGLDGRVLLHAVEGGAEPAARIALSEDPVVGLAFPRANQIIVGRPGGVQILGREDGSFAETRTVKTAVNGLAIDGAGAAGAAARGNGQVARFQLSGGAPAGLLSGHATEATLPFIVLWLVAGATFFTFRFGLVNLRAFRHAIDVTRGEFDDEHDDGDVSHFQALAMALSATVGLGNIAGVAVAVGTGGPGAVMWMIVAGFLGMSSKFAECTLGQMYRTIDSRGKVSGGPMHYLGKGLEELGMAGLGRVLATLFAILCIGGSLGGGNMFQANQSYAQVASVLPIFQGEIGSFVYGLLLSGLVGVVIIGGIDRIGQVASLIVPFMVGVYLLAAAFIVLANASAVPAALATIVSSAFSPGAAFGGALGVMVTGFRRAAFSNEAGVGSASIAHSAAATKEPVREGVVALLEPFIDTIVVCTTTALVIVITGAYETEADGVVMTSKAFETVIPWFPTVLTLAVFLFAFSTMISWSYYGERCWCFLFGEGSTMVYKLIFVAAVVLGSVIRLGSVLDFSDLMILAMAFPNIFGVVLLSGKVKSRLDDYLERLRSGAMKRT